MAPLTVIKPQPEAVEFRFARDGSLTAWVRLQNAWEGQVAYKMKTTSPKEYTIKPASGSIRMGEFHDVQIVQKPPEEGGGSPGSSKKVKFMVQAAPVTTQAQKLLLYAADKGKAAGRTKFWDSIPKEELQEQQLPVKLQTEEVEEFQDAVEAPVESHEPSSDATRSELWKARKARSQELKNAKSSEELEEGGPPGGAGAGRGNAEPTFEEPSAKSRKGNGRGEDADAEKSAEKTAARHKAQGYGAAGKLTDQDFDDIIGRMTKLGPDGKPVVQVSRPAPQPAPEGAEQSPSLRPSPAPDVERKPLQLTTASKSQQKHDVVLQGHSRPVTYLTFDDSGKVLYTCGKDKLVIAWSVPDGECLRKYEGHRGAVWACSVLNNDDGSLLLTCGADNYVLLWQAESAEILCQVELPGVVRCVEWCSHSLSLRFACCCNGFKAKPAAIEVCEFINIQGAMTSRCCASIAVPKLPSAATQVAWAGPYREWLCSVHEAGLVVFWDAVTGSEVARLPAHEDAVSKIAIPHSDGRLLASCGRQDMEVRLWCLARPESDDEESDFDDMGGGKPTPELMRNFTCDRPLNCVAIRPSLTFQQAAAEEQDAEGSCMLLAGGGQDARDVALVGAGTDVDQFEPIPLRFARTSTADSVVPLGLEHYPAEGAWDPKSRKGGHFGPLHALAFSPDAKLCASGSEDGNVRLRELL
mmetsp:Transcript_51561/g.112311  ORF Transcript_51561/g.112311 Transcript_51561/m.112311 type:complete len:695 (+) Transcript_51561:35-2119(+)